MNKFETGKILPTLYIKNFHAQQAHLFMLLPQRTLGVDQK